MAEFPRTQQSVLDRIQRGSIDVRHAAFDTLASAYWRPSYHYARLRWKLTPEDAEDAVQAFFAVALEKRYIEKFDPAKARFRTFLRLCLDRFIQNDRQAEAAQKRGGDVVRLSLDYPGAEQELARHLVAANDDPDAFFRDETIRSLCARTVDRLKTDLHNANRTRAYDVFARHDLNEGSSSYADTAAALGLTASQVTNDLHFARRRFRELALAELREITATDDEFRTEARDLFGVEAAE